MTHNTIDRVFSVLIDADRETVWRAITDSAIVTQWFYENTIRSSWTFGSSIQYLGDDGEVDIDGTILEISAPHRLDMTFNAVWGNYREPDAGGHVVWELNEENGATSVILTHYDLIEGSETEQEVTPGWPYLLSELKKTVEGL